MRTPTPLDDLVAEYTKLDRVNLSKLTADQARSLCFFRIERALTKDPAVAPQARNRAVVWVRHVRALDAFVVRHGRLPRENNRRPRFTISVDERVLADWVVYQRSSPTRDLHCDYQVRRLLCVPGFTWSPIEDRWMKQFSDYGRFLAEYGRVPRSRSTGADERHLAAWANKQRWRAARGRLEDSRRQLLSSLPIWTWPKKQ